MLTNLLHILDGYTCLDGCLICFTTNYPERVGEALKRPGRMDEIITFTYASDDVISRILMDFCGQTCPVTVQLTTSKLINEIILPNIDNFDRIRELCVEGSTTNAHTPHGTQNPQVQAHSENAQHAPETIQTPVQVTAQSTDQAEQIDKKAEVIVRSLIQDTYLATQSSTKDS